MKTRIAGVLTAGALMALAVGVAQADERPPEPTVEDLKQGYLAFLLKDGRAVSKDTVELADGAEVMVPNVVKRGCRWSAVVAGTYQCGVEVSAIWDGSARELRMTRFFERTEQGWLMRSD